MSTVPNYYVFVLICSRNSQQQGDFYNGFLFTRQLQQRAQNNLPFSYSRPSTSGFINPEFGTVYGPSTSAFDHQSLSPSSESSQSSHSPGLPQDDISRGNNNKRWDSAEVKMLIAAYKSYHGELKSTKSSKGKKAIWDRILADFKQACEEAGIQSEKSLAQGKEKWRALFEKYKAICDNNSKTGRGRETFEFYEIIDEFMGCSDKVRPKYVRETNIGNADDHCSSPATILETNEGPDLENVDQQGATTVTPAASNKGNKDDGTKKRKRKRGTAEGESEESELIKLIKAQQDAITRAEEKDERVMEAMFKFQAESEERHQQLLVSVLGKIGDIFTSKN